MRVIWETGVFYQSKMTNQAPPKIICFYLQASILQAVLVGKRRSNHGLNHELVGRSYGFTSNLPDLSYRLWMKHKMMNFLSTKTTEEYDLINKQITSIWSTCKTIRSIILGRHGEQLVMPHATTFQAQLCNQTQGLALHIQYSEQTLNTRISRQSNYLLLNRTQE